MDVISTTTPAPPSGVTPTEVPLGVSGTVSETTSPVNIPRLSLPIFQQQGRGIFLGSFAITSALPSGALAFDWSLQSPLTLGSTNLYTPVITPIQQLINFKIPWEYVVPFFSLQGKMDFDMEFIPVKVGDARVSMDIVFNQENVLFSTLNTTTLANDSVHKVIDDTDDPIRFSVPIIWMTNNIQSRSGILQPSFLPRTRVRAFIRNPYQPNTMQPVSFTVLVILHPKPHSLVGMGSLAPVSVPVGPEAGINYQVPWFIK